MSGGVMHPHGYLMPDHPWTRCHALGCGAPAGHDGDHVPERIPPRAVPACAACASSAAGCATHGPHVSSVDLMGRRIGILVERGFLVAVGPRGKRVRAIVVRGGASAMVHFAPTAPEAVAKAWADACTVDPMLEGLGLVLEAAA